MGLAALILVSESAVDSGPLPFGLTAIDLQARQAMAMGANPILIHAVEMGTGLSAALTRLKSTGHPVKLVRTNAEAANHIHPQENVLLYAGNVKFDEADPLHLRGSYIAVKPLEQGCADQELIDSKHSWSGIALLPGSLIRDVNGLVGDWALGPTLLRLAVQQGIEKRFTDGKSLTWQPSSVAGIGKIIEGVAQKAALKLPLWSIPFVHRASIALGFASLISSVADWQIAALCLFLLALVAEGFQVQTQKFLNIGGPLAHNTPSNPMAIFASLLLVIIAYSVAKSGGRWEVLVMALWWASLHLSAREVDNRFHATPATAISVTLIAALFDQIYWSFPIILAHSLVAYHLNGRSLGRH